MENEYEKNEKEIKENFDKMISGYFKEFLNKFDNFNNQLKIAELLIKAYQFRYDKYKTKFSSVNDVLASNYEEHKEFVKKIEKLDQLDTQMTQIEIKLGNLNRRVDSVINKE